MDKYQSELFPKSRIATLDIATIGLRKHHIALFLELDVTVARQKMREARRHGNKISFTAWLMKVVGITLDGHKPVAAYLKGRRKRILFRDINISLMVEKEIDGQKVPIPLVIEKANEISIAEITERIANARAKHLSGDDIVLHRNTGLPEKLYYYLPGFIRRLIWVLMLRNPAFAFSRMGNVAFTSTSVAGNVNGWFIPISVHPVCFGIGNVLKKPRVVNDAVAIREVLNVTVLIDHDVIDGAPMARFVRAFTRNVEAAWGI